MESSAYNGGAMMLAVIIILLVVASVLFIMHKAKYAMGKPAQDCRANDEPQTSATFVEATDGGWEDIPEVVAADGGSQGSYVEQQLLAAQAYAQKNVAIGEEFQYTITNIPPVASPHEIMFGMMMQAHNYGLEAGPAMNETFTYTRIK